MAPPSGNIKTPQVPGSFHKLARLPEGSKIQKRALNRRQIPSSSRSRIVYVSSSTPLVSALKRVRKQLDASLKTQAAAPKNASLHSRVEALKRAGNSRDGNPFSREGDPSQGTVVKVTGTGKAIEKVLKIASYFEQEGDCTVEVRTSTIGTVDDVVEQDEDGEEAVTESRIRRTSCLEASVKMK